MPRLSQSLDTSGRRAYRPPTASRLSATVPKQQKRAAPKPSTRPRRARRGGKALLAGGSMAFLAALAIVPTQLKPSDTTTAPQS
ncbi:MAG: hypothetical protein AAF152_20360, partial [Cyanobacteria bacterium P01_A01_bin.114]